jgi:hypothetical protein
MNKTNFLSAEEKERGFSNLKKHSVWNGLGFSFMTEAIIYLMAINFNATNVQLGYISSALFLSGVVLLIVPRLFAGVQLKKIFFWGWLLRGLVGLAYLLLFFIDGQAAVWLIMVIYTLFCLLRTLGVVANQPVVKSLLSSSNEGSRLIQLSTILGRSSLISRTISFAFLSIAFLSGIKGLIFLTFLGVVVNTIASLYILKIPSREKVEEVKSSQGIFSLMRETLRNREKRYYLIVLWLFVMLGVLNGFIIPFLQKEGGIPSNQIFLYAMIGVVGGLISNYFIKPYIDKTGSKPLLILVTLILGLTFIAWAMVPPGAGLLVFMVMGVFHTFFVSMGFNLTNRLFFKILPQNRNRLAFSSMNSFAGAVIALVTGLSAGKLADLMMNKESSLPHTYTLVFLIASAVAFTLALVTLFIKDRGSITLKEASELILYTPNRRAFLWTYQLSTTSDPQKRESTLLSLEKNPSDLATLEMKNQLNSPYSWEKERIFRSLFSYPRPDLADMVLAEADDNHSYNRLDALFALASYPGDETEEVLHRALEDQDPQVVSMALKSLTRLDSDKYIDLPEKIFPRISHSSHAVNDWFIACCEVDDNGRHLEKLFILANPDKNYRFQQLIFCLAARYYGKGILLAPYYQKSNSEPGRGLDDLLEEVREKEVFLNHEKEISQWYASGDYEKLIPLMSKSLPPIKDKGPAYYLKKAIDEITPNLMNPSSYLALVYFSYQVLILSGGENS